MARFTTYIQTFLATNGVAAKCVNINCLLNKRESYSLCRIYVTAKKSFPWACIKRNVYRLFAKSITTLYFLQQLSQLAKT